MNKEEILHKAIKKAEKNGFKQIVYTRQTAYKISPCYSVIFDPNFAKAFFGEEEMCKPELHNFGNHEGNCQDIEWQYHLQQMIPLSDDERIKYLNKFL